MWFANNFRSWLRHSWKLLANRLTRDPKIFIHGNSCIILYISIANALEILQSCTKSSICRLSAHRFLLLVPELQMSCRHLTTWWRQQMKTFSSLLALCEENLLVTIGFPHKGRWGRALIFSLICAWAYGGVNKRDASDLRRHGAHYAPLWLIEDTNTGQQFYGDSNLTIFFFNIYMTSIWLSFYMENFHDWKEFMQNIIW